MIGTYYRLSLADEDVGADKAESNSIQGQRGLVEGYIMARPELATEPRQEYVDDGYSGTSTSRPAFQRLIQDAQAGRKNLSGREMPTECRKMKEWSRFDDFTPRKIKFSSL